MKLEPIRFDDVVRVVHYVDDSISLASRGRRVFRSGAGSDTWEAIAEFPFAPPRDLISINRLARRLSRSDKCNVYPTRSGKLLGIRRGSVYDLDPGAGNEPRALASIQGECVMPRAIAEGTDGSLFFGEYFGNPDRIPVRVWRVDPDLDRCEPVYALPAGKARHVHAVHADPFIEGRLWVATGDFEGECHLLYTDDAFETVHFLGEGNQLWRMVGVIFQEDRLCWLTDTHIEQNYVVSMDRASCRAQIHAERDASSWYAAETTDGLYLATTTVEPGPGIRTDQVRLLASEDGLEWEAVGAWGKDALPMRGFGFGSISLPAGGYRSNRLWVSGEGIRRLDGHAQLCLVRR